MSDRVRPALLVITTVALVAGAFGLLFARDLAFTATDGARVGALFSLNLLGALVTIVLALVALAGTLTNVRPAVMLAGMGFAIAAAIQLLQSGADTNSLGGRPSTFSFFLAAAVGLIVLVVADRAYGSRGDVS